MGSVSDDQPSPNTSEKAARMKLLCSHGGKILPKADGQLRYVGGDTRLVSVKKSFGFAELRHKLEKIFGSDLLLKYQLPNEDLDALISVTCDEDVDNLKEEYDRNEVRDGASRLRAFLFPLTGFSSCSSDQFGEEARNSSEHQHGTQLQPVIGSDSSSMPFYLPDYLFGLDNAGHHVSHYQVQQDGDPYSSRYLETVTNRGDPTVTLGLPSKDTPPMPVQADYAATQQSSKVNFDDRGVPLSSSNDTDRRETEMLVDIEAQKEDKPSTELNGETGYNRSQRDTVTELSMNRIPSKDKIVHAHMEESQADGHSMIERQDNLQPIQHFELHNLEDVYTDVPGVLSDARQDAAAQVSRWLHNPPEVQRCLPQSATGVPAFEVPWGLRQPHVSGFDVALEKSADSRRGSGDSNEGTHRRIESQVQVENAVQPRPISTTSEGPADGFKYQDPNAAYEMPTLHAQTQPSQHFYQVGNFPQIYWQLQDPQGWQHHHMSYEPVQVAHSAPVLQRLVQPLPSHVPSSGADVLPHHMPSTQSNARSVLQSDMLPNTRLPSPLHRQVASAGGMRPDLQKPSRASSPLIEHPQGNSSLMSSRYGHHVAQVHEMGYSPTTVAHPSSGTPVPQAYMHPVEARGLYDQSGGQSHYVEKDAMGNCDGVTGQVEYTDKIIFASHDSAVGNVQYPDNNLQTSQYMWMSNCQDIQGVPLPQDTLGLHSHQ